MNQNEIDRENKKLLDHMVQKGEIQYGVVGENVPITLNNLIEFCKAEGISFDAPILLDSNCLYPLAYYYNPYIEDNQGDEHSLGLLTIITDGGEG